MRGDRPFIADHVGQRVEFTPHARGSTVAGAGDHRSDGVYPACAGIDLSSPIMSASGLSLPRMRGDRPWQELETTGPTAFTPHARGSTLTKNKKEENK